MSTYTADPRDPRDALFAELTYPHPDVDGIVMQAVDAQHSLRRWIRLHPDAAIAPAAVQIVDGVPRVRLGWTILHLQLADTASPLGRPCGRHWSGGGTDLHLGYDAEDALRRAGIDRPGDSDTKVVCRHPDGTETTFVA